MICLGPIAESSNDRWPVAKRKVLFAPRMDGEKPGDPARARKRWGQAFGETALSELNAAGRAALAGEHHMKRHSDGETPWQFALGDYVIRFSDKTPRGTERRDGGTYGIYLRDFNVRVATFAPNSAFLRNALSRMFDAAHALSLSWKAAEQQIVPPEAVTGRNHYRKPRAKNKKHKR